MVYILSFIPLYTFCCLSCTLDTFHDLSSRQSCISSPLHISLYTLHYIDTGIIHTIIKHFETFHKLSMLCCSSCHILQSKSTFHSTGLDRYCNMYFNTDIGLLSNPLLLLSANKFFSQCLLSVCVYSMYNYCVIVPIFIVPLVISNDKIQWMCGDGTTCCLWNCCNHIHLSVLTSPGEMTINQSIVWLFVGSSGLWFAVFQCEHDYSEWENCFIFFYLYLDFLYHWNILMLIQNYNGLVQ